LIGTTKLSRLAENLKSLDLVLAADEIANLDRAFANGAISGGRYPTQQMGLIAK
jgi:aryl-alcohol dehydrogenase-like predicted oxidoreductase